MPKKALYSTLITRMNAAITSSHFFEASWYAYAVLEDRLKSLLDNTGSTRKKGKEIRMMGPKIKELKSRAVGDALLNVNFERIRLTRWAEKRNKLMHAMANDTLTIIQIDQQIEALAKEGKALVKDYTAACRRLKKHRKKV